MSIAYTNPVYPHYFADPFVLRVNDDYYAYGTAPASPEGWHFPVLHSTDLVHWTAVSWALPPLPGAEEYWAPEVAVPDGNFYLYYSAKGINGKDHQLRVAVSKSPLGPFEDSGRILTPDDPFTIDAHPFRDRDGQWYLYYARDFLTIDQDFRVGTGIVVDRLMDMLTLAGDPRLVVRPYADWQLFKAGRVMYGATYDWYTVEGPAVRLHNNQYYCFYSGGAWAQENYGVAFVVSDHPLGSYARPLNEDSQVMRSVPGQVIGPGHNSFVESPDGMQEYVIYHAWDAEMTKRLMRIDLLTWDDDTPVFHGPTWTPQVLNGET